MEPMELSIKTEMEAKATSAVYRDIEIDLNSLKQDSIYNQRFLKSVKSEPCGTNDVLLKEEILVDSSQDDSEQQSVHATSTPAGAGGVTEIFSTILDDLINIKYESEEMDIGLTVFEHMDTHYTINKNISTDEEENTVVFDFNEAIPGSGVKKENIEGEWRGGNEQQCIHRPSTPPRTGGVIETYSTSTSITKTVSMPDLFNIKYELAEMDIGPTVLQHMDTHYTIHKEMSAEVENTCAVGYNEAMPGSGVKKEKIDGEWTDDNKATLYNCYQTTTEVDYDDAHMNSHLGQQKDFQKHLLHQHRTTNYNDFKCDTTFHKPHLLSLPEKLQQRNSRKAMTNRSTVASTIDQSGNNMTKTKQKPFQCDVCEKGYTLKAGLNLHKRSIFKQKFSVDLKNNLVNYEYHTKQNSSVDMKNNLVNYDSHTKINHCNLDVKFTQRGDLTKNMAVDVGEKPYKCKICDTRFTGSSNLTKHMTCHTGEKRYHCKICDARFTASSNLTTHMTRHTGEKLYQCKLCDARFAHSSTLTQHVRVHTGEKPYQCKICDARFSQRSGLTQHVRVHTGEKPYQCKICDARVAQSHNLIRHMRVHTGEKPYKCKICDARFPQNTNLTHHMKLHTGEKPYQCMICDARFTVNSNLTKHMVRHTGEKPYECKVCDARFAYSSTLTQHVRVHTGEKPYQCKICYARFAHNNNLNQHMRVHTGEKPYQCKICDARFAQNSHLTQHMRVHKGEKPYHCKICDASFTQSSSLAKHLRVHTREKPC